MFKHTFCLQDQTEQDAKDNLNKRNSEMKQRWLLLYKHIFYTYGRYFGTVGGHHIKTHYVHM